MPKRKRSVYDEDGDRVLQMRKKDVSEKLVESKKLLHKALKTAKRFERQRLGKRLKDAIEARSNDEVARINSEIEALKGLDLDKMTEAQLFKGMLKIKAFAQSEFVPEEVRRELPKPQGTEEEKKAMHNVVSGLWNMKLVKDAMEKVVSGMYLALGIPAPPVERKKTKKEHVENILKGGVISLPRKVEADEREELEQNGATSLRELSWEGFNSEDESKAAAEADREVPAKNEVDDEDDELDEEALSRYDAFLGGSSDEESFDESKYNIERTSKPSARLSLSLSPEPSELSSPSEGKTQSPSPPPQKALKHTKSKTKEPPKKPGGSTFLPTLMGGYWSGSESSASDLEDDEITAAPVRKNRPGQMARRAIWEKKFKEEANHIKSGQGAVAEKRAKGKDDGWDAKHGATDSSGRNRRRGPAGRQRDFRQATGENAISVKPGKRGMVKKDDAGVLHPSWVAAKKAKEVKTMAKFQGKKVTFG